MIFNKECTVFILFLAAADSTVAKHELTLAFTKASASSGFDQVVSGDVCLVFFRFFIVAAYIHEEK